MEPSPTLLGGTSPVRTARRLFLATRPRFFAASVLPIALGSAWGYRASGALDLAALTLATLAVVLIHAGANIFNDVYDDLVGGDRTNEGRIHPYTGGSRFIQNGVLSLGQMRALALAVLGLGLALGVILAVAKGWPVIGFGAAGVALGLSYSVPPFRLSDRGFGEISVGLAFGVLPVMGSAWLQSGRISLDAAFLSLPMAFWIASILLINEVPDATSDALAGRKTLAVRLGKDGTRRLYLALHGAAALIAAGLAVGGLVSQWLLVLVPLLFVPAWSAAGSITRAGPDKGSFKRGIEMSLAVHAFGGVLLAAGVLSR